MRKFYLINALGQKISLQDKNNAMFFYPEGLGFERSFEYQNIREIFAEILNAPVQKRIPGTLVFVGTDVYKKYRDFMLFIAFKPLRLIYETDTEFFINVNVSKTEKGELTVPGLLQCAVEFETLGRFYKTVSAISKIIQQQAGKTYPYEYSYTYQSEISQTVNIASDSPNSSPCKIVVIGPAVNPSWYHYLNGVQRETGLYRGNIPDGHRLIIDTTDVPYQINEFNEAGEIIADRYASCDFSTERFCFVEYGSNTFSVAHEGQNQIQIAVEAQLEYDSV